jgi:hypothetical protein
MVTVRMVRFQGDIGTYSIDNPVIPDGVVPVSKRPSGERVIEYEDVIEENFDA